MYPSMIYSTFFNNKSDQPKTMQNDSKSQITLLSIPLKHSIKVVWKPALLAYIKSGYAEDDTKYEQDAILFDKIRNKALEHDWDSSLAIQDLSIYFDQLTFIGSRFPLDINLDIGWFPIFKPKEKPEIISNLNYEKASVLYRIAGIYSQLGCSQSWISTEGIRKACQYFQNAAGCLKHIKSNLLPDLRAEPPKDFLLVDAFISLMMAQAHECVCQKAIMEHLKYGTLARLAIKVSDLYNDFLQSVTTQDINIIPEQWIACGEIKSNYFKSFAHYQKANESISNGRYGEEIARLNIANESVSKILPKLSSDYNDYSFLHNQYVEKILALKQSIDQDLARAEKDNDIVYMHTVPEPNQLAPILRSDMVKPTLPSFVTDPHYWLVITPPTTDDQSLFIKRPLFEKLVPFAIHQAASVYADKKNLIVHTDILAHATALTHQYHTFLQDHHLPYTLDIVDRLPQSLLDCAEEVQQQGGIQSLQDMLHNIQNMGRHSLKLIEEGFNALEQENEQDVAWSNQYGKLWSRPSSRDLTHGLLVRGSQFHDTVQAAQKADRIVQAKVSNWGKAIAMLSRPTQEIEAHLPSLQKFQQDEEADADSAYEEMVELLSKIRDCLKWLETEAVERQEGLRQQVVEFAEKDDVSEALLERANELTRGSPNIKLEPEQFKGIFETSLMQYKKWQDEIKVLTSEQEDRLQEVKEMVKKFSLLVSNRTILSKREKAISNLEAAFVKFKEIRINLVEGIKFYSNYTDSLTEFRDECMDFIMARGLEATELARDTSPSRMLLRKK